MADVKARVPSKNNQKQTLANVLSWLVADGLLGSDDASSVRPIRSKDAAENHPLALIATRDLSSAKPPHKTLTLETLTTWFAERVGLPYYRIDPLKVDVTAVTAVMSYNYARHYNILCVAIQPDKVIIATAEPDVTEWEKELNHVLRKPIERVIANPLDISRYLVEFYALSRSVQQARGKTQTSAQGEITNLEQLVELGRRGRLDANDQHIINIVDWLLQYAFEQRASDIHIEPRRDDGNVRFRIDGVLHLVYQMPTPVMAAVISRVKILGRMDLAEKRRPLDGRLKTKSPDGKEIELRLSTMPTAFGEKLVMRIFDPDVLVKNFRELGFNNDEIACWQSMVGQPTGIVLVTGPTGSGKTTTLYSTLKQLATPDVNVCTVEDPIEMVEQSFNQTQTQQNIGLDFATGVRALLRQDPDIIMVGEIRDLETAEMAVQAALTGHLVLSTLHTNDAPSAITRLLDLGVPPYLLNATLLGVVAQRLVRTLCPHCKEAGDVDLDDWKEVTRPWRVTPPEKVYYPKGCLECRNTGYLGRVGIYEILRLSASVRELVQSEIDVSHLRDQARKEGMRSLRLSGAEKVHTGLTTIEEILKMAPNEDKKKGTAN
ncbi:MAG: type II/IV secretion system protein [Gammaproteobacteria bacterium]|nr:type II/IV secretion system protein [Gammaproteobacteria bacterium]